MNNRDLAESGRFISRGKRSSTQGGLLRIGNTENTIARACGWRVIVGNRGSTGRSNIGFRVRPTTPCGRLWTTDSRFFGHLSVRFGGGHLTLTVESDVDHYN